MKTFKINFKKRLFSSTAHDYFHMIKYVRKLKNVIISSVKAVIVRNIIVDVINNCNNMYRTIYNFDQQPSKE